jgi:hypothetical protein
MFRTELTLAPAAQQLSRTARVLTLGSCFADSMGARLVANKVETLVNPFGTVFQPLMLGQLLRAAAGEDMDWQQHITEARGRWQSYDLHGSIGAASPVELLQHIQLLVQRTGDFVRQADMVVLTLGTAWAYRLRETGELVSNCHKQPADLFHKELLTPDEIINALAETHAYLRRINPKLKFVLTVSPVRHLKDTLPLNAVSKSVLRVACHYLSDLLPDVAYFPAYELLTDDLRDYRFYASDMLHPSEVAEDYIWEKFARTYFDADFGRFRKEWAAVRQSLGHRPLYEGAPEHRHFLEGTRERLRHLAEQQIEVGAELQGIEQRIAALPVPIVVVTPEIEDDGEERIDIGAAAGVEVITPVAGAATGLPVGAEGDEATASTQPGRLSPEEFRSQRNRDRNRRGRNDRRNRTEGVEESETQPVPELVAATPLVTAPVEEEDELEEVELEDAADETADASATSLAYQVLGLGAPGPAQTTATAGADAGLEPLEGGMKKKKRRSRGGAKRTARKHAARLAVEGFSAEGNETADSVTTPMAEVTSALEPQPAVELSEAANTLSDSASLLPELPAVAIPEPEGAPKWSSRGEGKKSTVIKKSTPVKRGGRRLLFNTPTAENTSIIDAASVVETPLPELPDLPTLSAEPEIPAVAVSTGAVEAILNNDGTAAAEVSTEESTTAKRNRNRNRGKGHKPAPAATEQEAVAEMATPAPDVAPAAPAAPEPAAAGSADTTVSALLAAVSSRRTGTKKPASAVAKPVIANEVVTPEPTPQLIEIVAAAAPVGTPNATAKPSVAARPSRSKAKPGAAAPQEPVTEIPVAPPLPLAEAKPVPPRRSRAAKPVVAAPTEASLPTPPPKAPTKAKPKAAPKTAAAEKPKEKPKPVRKTAKKA